MAWLGFVWFDLDGRWRYCVELLFDMMPTYTWVDGVVCGCFVWFGFVCRRGVVVITSALHAEGRRFEPGR